MIQNRFQPEEHIEVARKIARKRERRCADPMHSATDLESEGLLAMYQRRFNYDDRRGSMESFAWTICHSRICDATKNPRPTTLTLLPGCEGEIDTMAQVDTRDELNHLLTNLNSIERDVVMLRHGHDWKFEEIGLRYGKSKTWAYLLYSEAMRKVREGAIETRL